MRTSPSAGRLVCAGVVDLVFVFGAVDAAYRASGSGSIFAQLREGAALDAAAEAAGAAAATQNSGWRDEEPARRRREGLVAAGLWLSVVAWADANAGRTPGRAVAGLRLERRDGQHLTLARAVIRESTPRVRRAVLKALWPQITRGNRQVAFLASVGLVFAGLAVRAVDDQRRTMGDWVAGTRLVQG